MHLIVAKKKFIYLHECCSHMYNNRIAQALAFVCAQFPSFYLHEQLSDKVGLI
jgi:hypothetical protein